MGDKDVDKNGNGGKKDGGIPPKGTVPKTISQASRFAISKVYFAKQKNSENDKKIELSETALPPPIAVPYIASETNSESSNKR